MEKFKEIFDNKESLINLNDDEITSIDDLEWIASELEQNRSIHFINWHNNQLKVDQNPEIKTRILTRLVSNLINEKKNDLVIDLSDFKIDLDYLTIFAQAISQTIVGKVILGEQNENLSQTNEWSQILSCLSENNRKFQRYPSDIVHCMLASYCRCPSKSDVWSKLEQLGWSIENELEIPDQDYYSILFKNESTRHLVLAFQGLTFNFNECLSLNPQDETFTTKLRDKLASSCYYAYLHSRSAFELSKEKNYWLSFTGHGYGAWLAELSVLYCYQEYGSTRIRAVTFDSPGSGEIFSRIDENEDFNELLDIKTYLTCPNFVNTSSTEHYSIFDEKFSNYTKPPQHLGAVYFLNEISLEKSNQVSFIKNNKYKLIFFNLFIF